MSIATFKTHPVDLEELLNACGTGKIQLPDFQRSWVWDEERIKSLIGSISQGFPVGALMTLETKAGAAATFARRPVQGAAAGADQVEPDQLLLDGQQRMTSLYQTCMRNEVVITVTPRMREVKRWFYLDMTKSLDPLVDRVEAILGVPEDRRVKTDFDKTVVLDLSTPEREFENLMFPLHRAFDWEDWREGFDDYWYAKGDTSKRDLFKSFKKDVLQNFSSYRLPVIALGAETSHEAVCLVFEKVNTGGKPLDAFELVTAMYAAKGHRLRDDWLGTKETTGLQKRLATFGHVANQKFGVLEKVAATDVLQTIALLHSAAERYKAVAAGKTDKELPPVRATRQSLLDLPLEGYLAHREAAEKGFTEAAKFLRQLHIYRVIDLPYQGQLVPLAAIFATLGEKAEHSAVRKRIARWYWCGIFGELYGSAIETRFAKDLTEVALWALDQGPEPTTVFDGRFRPDRLRTMRTRLSAAYKGIHALLMAAGAKDFRTGETYEANNFFDDMVDIHHICPQNWCKKNKISEQDFDSVINKTPLTARTNRILGGDAPSEYLGRLERGGKDYPPLSPSDLDEHLLSHAIDPILLRADNFVDFTIDREKRLLMMIEGATGHSILRSPEPEEGREALTQDEVGHDA